MTISYVDGQQGSPVPALSGLQDGDTLFAFTAVYGVSLGLYTLGFFDTDIPHPWCYINGIGGASGIGSSCLMSAAFRRWSTGDPTSYQMRSSLSQAPPANAGAIIVAYRGLKAHDFRLNLNGSSCSLCGTTRTIPAATNNAGPSDALLVYAATAGSGGVTAFDAAVTDRINDGVMHVGDEILSPAPATFPARTFTFTGGNIAVTRFEPKDHAMV